MGWDITYHAFSPDEVKSVYFRGVQTPDHGRQVAADFNLDETDARELCECFAQAAQFGADTPFSKGHAFAMAAVAGYLRKYWYLRGSAFSFLIDEHPAFSRYTLDWRNLIPTKFVTPDFQGVIIENYCGGVFLGPDGLRQLQADYLSDEVVKAHMDEFFSHGRLAVFWKAVEFAIEHNLGLIEATDLVVPNPLDLSRTQCISNLGNCEIEGAHLYVQAMAEQLREISQSKANSPPVEPPQLPPIKKGFFARFFGN